MRLFWRGRGREGVSVIASSSRRAMRLPLVSCAGILFLLSVLAPCFVMAEGISGYLEYGYSRTTTDSKDIAGNDSKYESDSLTQRYSVILNKDFFPNLHLNAGGLFTVENASTGSDQRKEKSTNRNWQPNIDLTMGNRLINAGIGYSKGEETFKTSGQSSFTKQSESYKAFLGWRPWEFPSLDITFRRSTNSDGERVSENTKADQITVSTQYNSIKGLELRYDASFFNTEDKISGVDVRDQVHNGTASYHTTFYNKRLSLNTKYNINWRDTVISSGQNGEVKLQLFPFSGLAGLTDTPTMGVLDPNGTLIDGDLVTSSGVNIGVVSIGGDNRPRNIGLDFLNQNTEVNALHVWVNRKLPSEIANFYSWDVYASETNPESWVFLANVSPAPIGSFDTFFEIRFPKVKTRFIKVVVRPLSRETALLRPDFRDPDQIFITEFQAFNIRSAQEVGERVSLTFYSYALNFRALILKVPSVSYDFSFNSDSNQNLLINGFSGSQRFNKVFSGDVRVSREDGWGSRGDHTTYQYFASIAAVPIRALRHQLIYNGKNEQREGTSSLLNGFALNNTAQLYKGINLYLNGSLSYTVTDRRNGRDMSILFGSGIVPNPKFTLNINYRGQKSDQSGGATPVFSSVSRLATVVANFRPVSNLYLTTSLTQETGNNRDPRTMKGFGVNWSPFAEGNLQVALAYSESLTLERDESSKTLTPSMTWRINSFTVWDMYYNYTETESPSQRNHLRNGNTNLRIYF